MKLVIPKGATSRIVTIFIQDSSATTGDGLGSLTNASSIVGGFVREGSTGVALAVDEDVTTEGTYQAPSAQGKVRIGTPANMRTGTYELHFHNNLWATGAEAVTITLGGATNMADLAIEVQLSDPVRGLGAPTALPNAAADAAGGLPISDAGGLDLDAKIGALTYGTANRVNVQVYGMEAGTVTAAAIATAAIDADAIATDAIGAAEFSQAAADKVWATAARTLTAATNITSTGGTITVTAGGVTLGNVAHGGPAASFEVLDFSVDGVLFAEDFQSTTFDITDVSILSSLEVGGNTTFGGTTTFTGAVTASNASNDIRLGATERSSIATAVWAAGTRTLTSFGTLAADVWAAASRTLTAFSFTPTPSNAADTTAILADTNELQTDWTNGGRLDLIVDAILDDTGSSGVVVASASKTGYSLASDGLDSVSTTAPSGVASNFREMLVQTWRRFFKKTDNDDSAGTIKTYADNGTTVVTTQTVTEVGDTTTVGAAT